GAVTSRPKVALRSGCSKTGKMRRASAGSHCEYKYSASSNGSTNRCKPSPGVEYGADECTTSPFWACKSAKFNRAPRSEERRVGEGGGSRRKAAHHEISHVRMT